MQEFMALVPYMINIIKLCNQHGLITEFEKKYKVYESLFPIENSKIITSLEKSMDGLKDNQTVSFDAIVLLATQSTSDMPIASVTLDSIKDDPPESCIGNDSNPDIANVIVIISTLKVKRLYS